jgi:predicted phage-related endonuclease
MRLGTFLEPFVVNEYERVTGNTCEQRPEPFFHAEYPELFGHVDRMVTIKGNSPSPGERVVLECKTCSAFRSSEWGPAWSDLVPAEYLVQCLWYLGLTGCEEAHLAVLLGNTDLRIYRVRRDLALERHIFERAHSFWVDHVLTGTPPQPQTREQVELLHPSHVPGISHEAGRELLESVSRYAQLQQEIKAAQEESEQLRDRIALSMGPAETLTWAGNTIATWRRARDSLRLDTERLRRERPDVVEAYTRPCPSGRRLLLKPAEPETQPHTIPRSTNHDK